MRKGRREAIRSPSEALAEDGCPLCRMLKEFQSSCVRSFENLTATSLCNYHTWLVAGTSEAALAAEVFLRLLESKLAAGSKTKPCDLCTELAREETLRVNEYFSRLGEPEFLEWLQEKGEFCIPHGQMLLNRAPAALQGDIYSALHRNGGKLKRGLVKLLRDAQVGNPVHGGLLGRVAEYLASQRGLGQDK